MGLALKGLRPKFRDHPLKMLWKLVLVFSSFKCFLVFYSKFCRMMKRIETNENSAQNDWKAIIRRSQDLIRSSLWNIFWSIANWSGEEGDRTRGFEPNFLSQQKDFSRIWEKIREKMCDYCFRIHYQEPEAAVPRHFLTGGNQNFEKLSRKHPHQSPFLLKQLFFFFFFFEWIQFFMKINSNYSNDINSKCYTK